MGHKYLMAYFPHIKQVHLEISTRCNASCPLCPRNLSGYDTDLGYPVHDMRLEEAQKIFTVPFLSQLNSILINGNFGDFVTARDGLAIVKYFVEVNPKININISTNGSARPQIWEELGKIPNVTVGFDIDGLKDTHDLYRRNTSWDMVIENAKRFIEAGGQAHWRMIEFDHNRHQIEDCRRMAMELKFSRFNIINDGRTIGPVYNRDGDYIYKLGNDPKFENYDYPKKATTWEDWILVGSTPEKRRAEYPTIPIKSQVKCQAKQKSEVYITATGEVYPCCWLGMYPKMDFKHSWQADNFAVKELLGSYNNNALEVGVEAAMDWMHKVEESWNKKAYSNGRLFKCDQYCGH